jgi:hypothetical protein
MQYQFTERLEYIKTIEFFNTNPLHIEKIRYFQEEGVTGTITKREFTYSWDNITWSNWNTLTLGNLTAISFRDRPDFYLKLRYTRSGISSGNILRWYLIYDELAPTPPGPTPDTSINAWWFRGQGPEYFLDRSSNGGQYGPYDDLNVENVPDGSTIGVYHGRLDTSLGTNLYFKRVKGVGGITVEDSSAGIISFGLDASVASGGVYASSLDPSVAMPSTVGGIPAGTKVADLNGDTLSSLWDALLFPVAYPALNNPSGSFNVAPSTTLYEVSTNISLTFTAGFNRGSISPQYTASSPYRSGLPNNYHFTGTGLVDASSTALSYSPPAVNYYIKQGNQLWSTTISYDAGVQPYDSKGNVYNSPYPAGSLSGGTITIEGAYPLFGTTISINTLTKQPLLSMISANNIIFAMVAESGGNKQTFEIPNVWLNSRPLVGIKTYNLLTQQFEYSGGSAAASKTFWTTSADTQIIQTYTIPYTKYTFNSVDRSAIQIQLVF